MKSRRSWRFVPVLLLPALAACIEVSGELGNLRFELPLVDPLVEFESGDRLLVGSRVCPAITAGLQADGTYRVFLGRTEEAAARACFAETVEGPAELDAEGCFSFDAPGEVTWTLTPTGECEWPDDRLRFDVVVASPELRLGFDDWRARAPMRYGSAATVIGLAPGRSVDDLREDPAAPRLVAGNALDTPLLRLDDLDGRLFWTLPEVSLELVGDGVTSVEPIEDDDAGIYEFQLLGELPLRLELGGVARVRATLPDGQLLESPELIGVSATTAASLDLVVLADAETDLPIYAFAEARDSQGRVLHGAPIEWGMQEGALAVTPGDLETEVRTADHALLAANCEPPSPTIVQRRAVLRARLGALEDTVELIWTEEAASPETLEFPFTPDQACLFGDDSGDGETGDEGPGAELGDGCGCTSRGPTSPLTSLLVLLGLGLLRRRPASSLRPLDSR